MHGVKRWTRRALGLGLGGVLCSGGALAAPAEAVAPPAGCPARPEVVPLTSMTIRGAQREGWVAHQVLIPEARDTFFHGAERRKPGWKSVTPEQARKLGAPDPAVPLWVFGVTDTPACRSVPSKYWAVRSGHVQWETWLVAELTSDCELPAPGTMSELIVAVRQQEAPSGCLLRREDFREGARDTPLVPAEVAAQVPVRECALPGCELRWSVSGSRWETGATVYNVMVTQARRQEGKPCREVKDFNALMVRPPGASQVSPLPQGGEYLGALHDGAGVKFVLSHHLGVLSVHDLARPKAAPGTVRFNTPDEEALEHKQRTLAPPCEH